MNNSIVWPSLKYNVIEIMQAIIRASNTNLSYLMAFSFLTA